MRFRGRVQQTSIAALAACATVTRQVQTRFEPRRNGSNGARLSKSSSAVDQDPDDEMDHHCRQPEALLGCRTAIMPGQLSKSQPEEIGLDRGKRQATLKCRSRIAAEQTVKKNLKLVAK